MEEAVSAQLGEGRCHIPRNSMGILLMVTEINQKGAVGVALSGAEKGEWLRCLRYGVDKGIRSLWPTKVDVATQGLSYIRGSWRARLKRVYGP